MSRLKEIRIFEVRISQFELAKRSGVHPSRLSLIENDLTAPTENERKKISEALEMSLGEIFGELSRNKA